MSEVTTFKIERDSTGIKVVRRLGKKIEKETYALNHEHANWVRGLWIDEFWGFNRNKEILLSLS